MTSIPDIDLGPLCHDDCNPSSKARHATIAQLRHACADPGFFYAYDTNVSDDLIERAYAQSARFHALPDDAAKRQLHENNSPYRRGWLPSFDEPAYEPDSASYCASFNLGLELPPQPRRGSYGNLGPNVWPELDGFRNDIYDYYLACSELAQVLFRTFAQVLDLPEQFFTERSTGRSPSTMRLLHYPARQQVVAPSGKTATGISAHTDFECFTLMHQTAPGLQLMTTGGDWIEAPAHRDRFIVILGDMLERWTNGQLRATRHRVVDTPRERYSLIYFSALDQDVVVEPLPQFVSTQRPSRYPPVTQRQHLNGELQSAFANLGTPP